ncbi:hypothetical protein GF323_03885 [Candidatus Woesearchaeota archaeon]|nr:hypothetical protein [Candidatus Woesearchaeota archaeon]
MQRSTKVYLEIEKSKIKREKARLVLEKSIFLYFLFMLIAVLGFIYNYIGSFTLNALILLGIIILIIGTIPYLVIVHKEEKKIEGFMK